MATKIWRRTINETPRTTSIAYFFWPDHGNDFDGSASLGRRFRCGAGEKTQNPIANLISLPLQSDWNYDSGPKDDKTSYTLNVQPVWPFSVSEDYLLITRTIMPVKSIEFPKT